MTPEAASQTAINQFTDSAISKTIKALSILSIDPANLRGAVLKSRSGPIRESLLALLPKLFLGSKFQKIYPSVTDAQLFGGIDFAHTFKTGKPVKTKGLLNTGNATILLLDLQSACGGLRARSVSPSGTVRREGLRSLRGSPAPRKPRGIRTSMHA